MGNQMSLDGIGQRKPLVILVTGTRELLYRDLVRASLSEHFPAAVIHGGATGVDSYAGEWARDNGVAEVVVKAQWDRYEKRAGTLRNEWMLLLNPQLVLGFPSAKSRGTLHMMTIAHREGIPVINSTGHGKPFGYS